MRGDFFEPSVDVVPNAFRPASKLAPSNICLLGFDGAPTTGSNPSNHRRMSPLTLTCDPDSRT